MKKIIYLTVSIIMLTFCSTAQKKISYKTIEDDPSAVHKLSITLNPFYFDFWSTIQISGGVGLDARYRFNDRFNFTGRFDHSNYFSTSKTLDDKGKENTYNYFEVGAGYILKSSEKTKPITVRLGEDANYVHLIEAKGKKRNELVGRFGSFNSSTPYEDNYIDYDMKTFGYYAGISWINFSNLTLKVDGYSKYKRFERYYDTYFDIMHAPVVKLDPSHDKKALGWRLGLMYYSSLSRMIAFSSRMELGSRPGYKESSFGWYWSMGLTVNIL